MKRLLALAAICTLWMPGVAPAKSNPAEPLTGTWQCVAHGFPQGNVPFTLYLKERPDNSVTGWVRSPLGTADLFSVTFKNNDLEIRINAPHGGYRLSARHQGNRFTGTWSRGSSLQGKWEGKRTSHNPNPE